MRVPLQWLADYVEITLPVDELAHLMTMKGLKVEAIERPATGWQDVVIGQVARLEAHPKSNKPLWVAAVDLGGREITVVTGAPNLRVGDKAPVVLVGGLLPHGPDGEPMMIQRKPMAGITSEGMLASQRELGISDEHSGIYVLPDDAPVGRPLRDIMGGDVLEIETHPNRPDTLSIIGIAREVAAMTQQQVTPPDLGKISDTVQWLDEESIPVDVEAPDLCPRYSALRIEGIGGAGTSPTWIASRLEAAGMRPISLLVDITNYVMLEYGQPMHAFDSSALRGGRIIVRRARDGEHMKTLDGTDRQLTGENLVIADAEGPVAIAGVMGGENSEIADDTDAIVLESATFDPISVRRTARSLGLRTESSSRFEKGLPPEGTMLGIQRYLQLLAQITGRPLRVARVSDAYPRKSEPRTVTMPLRDLHRLTGLNITAGDAAEQLSLLGFGVEVVDRAVRVDVPFWRRVDIEASADVVEEVIRMIGYDEVPTTLPRRTMEPLEPDRPLRWEGAIAGRLLAAGLSESATHALTSPEAMARLSLGSSTHPDSQEFWESLVANAAGVYEREAETLPVVLANPATRDRRVLRHTLVPSLVDVVSRNLKNTDEHVAFFEINRTLFRRPERLPYERRTLAIALSGNRSPRSWQDPKRKEYTFYDAKGLVETVLSTLHIRDWTVAAHPHPALHPGRAAVVRIAGHDIGYFGELHPTVAQRFEIDDWPVQVAEFDLDTMFEHAQDTIQFRPTPRFPAAYRDIAVVVDIYTQAADIVRVIEREGRGTLESYRIFDVYQGAPLPVGKKSIAVGMTFRAPGATLTQEEVAEVVDGIVAALDDELKASIRE